MRVRWWRERRGGRRVGGRIGMEVGGRAFVWGRRRGRRGCGGRWRRRLGRWLLRRMLRRTMMTLLALVVGMVRWVLELGRGGDVAFGEKVD